MNTQINISFRKTMGRNLMCLEPLENSENIFIEDFRTKMILNNSIKGILKTHIQYTNSKPSFCYDISGLQSLSIILESKPLDYNLLSHLIYNIYDTLLSCEKYMLDVDKLQLVPEQLFLNSDYSNISLCYLPLKNEDFTTSMKSLFEYLLKHIDHKDEKCVYVTYSIHNHCLKDILTPNILLSFLSSDTIEQTNKISMESTITNPKINHISTTNSDDYATFTRPLIASQPDNYLSNEPINLSNTRKLPPETIGKICFLATCLIVGLVVTSCFYLFDFIDLTIFIILLIILFVTCAITGYNIFIKIEGPINALLSKDNTKLDIPSFYLEDTGDTVLLSTVENNNSHMLIYTGSDMNSQVDLTHYPFTIGKSNDCDLVLSNPIISRLHSRISCNLNDKNITSYFLEDLNSTNGTYINGTLISPYKKYNLSSGDNVTFGHLTYIFR